MKLILAQGNPSEDYDGTRHNVGFTVLDAFARSHQTLWQPKDKFKALIGELIIDAEKILLVKPQTYYNETGLSARAIIDFYKLDPSADVLVIHDELALPFGTLRTREKGSDAGNNGIKSLNTHIGPEYKRIRIGIANDQREIMGDTAFVLGRFTPDEQAGFSHIIEKTHRIIDGFLRGEFNATSSVIS